MYIDDIPAEITENTQYLNVIKSNRWNIQINGISINGKDITD